MEDTGDDSPPLSFLGLKPNLTCLETSRYVILPAPYEKTTTYGKGTEQGPEAILQASQQVETFDEELWRETCSVGIHTARAISFHGSTPEEDLLQISKHVAEFLSLKKKVITLGGEHTVTVGAVEPFVHAYPDLCVLQLDAHADLRDTFEGTPYNHACVMRRLLDVCPVVQVGIRNLSLGEAELVQGRQMKLWLFRDLARKGWLEEMLSQLSPHVYLTLDVDAMDPAVIPSTGTPEPGGFTWDTLLEITRAVAQRANIVGADVTELAPIPGLHAPDFTIAKFVYRLIGYMEISPHQD
jgi:agmatinase